MAATDLQPRVEFPRLSQILDSRRQLVVLLRDQYKERLKRRPVWLFCGERATKAYAAFYKRIMIEENFSDNVIIYALSKAPSEEEAVAIAQDTYASGQLPGMVAYVGGQTIGDSAKAFLFHLRKMFGKKKPPAIIFGGIITALSNDGVFSDTASVFTNDVARSFKATPPNFILGHQLTLLRQPFAMKASCIGDILAKLSSLWDYNYSCDTLKTYHNDFAVDLAKSAHDKVLGRDINIDISYLHTRNFVSDLFRAVQLCGLSMQLAGNSATCSGSEHLGWKWLADYMKRLKSHKRIEPMKELTHGAGVLLMTIITLYLQGQSEIAAKVSTIAENIDLELTAESIGIPGEAIQVCLALGVGNRCPGCLSSTAGSETVGCQQG
jgi:glycerol dehydrogenase-like iron-containing ADH family enzyme